MLENYIKDTISKGLLDMDMISQALDTMKARSFKYQTTTQANEVKFDRYDLDMGDFKYRVVDPTASIVRKRYLAYVDFDMITRNRKLEYKRSELYRKEVSIFDIKDNPRLFDYNYIAFIDGKFVDFIHIIPSDTGTTIVFNKENGVDKYGLDATQINDLVKSGRTLTIFFLPNTIFGAYTVDVEVLKKYAGKLSLTDSGINNNLTDDMTYLSFISSNEFGFSSKLINPERKDDYLRFYDLPEGKAHINIFGFKYLYKKVDVLNNRLYLSDTAMPISKENIILFKVEADGSHSFAHDLSIRHQYPNIYHIEGNYNNAPIVALLFYYDGMDDSLPEMIDELEVYTDLVTVDNMHPLAINYNPEEFVYSIEDFEQSEYYPNYNEYKLSRFHLLMKKNRENVRDYLKKRLQGISGYYIEVKDVDLEAKRRWHNRNEITNINQQKDFTEERFVFIFKNENIGIMNARILIDGLLYRPDEVYKKGIYEYYYIPTRIINSDSVIDIEVYDVSKDIIEFTPPVATVSSIKLGRKMSITYGDTYITDIDGNYIDESLYTLSVRCDDKSFINLENVSIHKSFTDRVYITVDPSLVGVKLKLYVEKSFRIQSITVEQDEDLVTFFTKGKINPNTKRFLVYKNGRLIPPSLYRFKKKGNIADDIIIYPGLAGNLGDEFTLLVTPYNYTTVFEGENLPAEGFLDLRGIVERPYDIQWYDTHSNGRMLAKSNLMYIAPRVLGFNNITSRKNILILVKDDYKDHLDYTDAENIIETLLDIDTNFKEQLIASLGNIIDNEDDYLTDIIIPEYFDLINFFNKEMRDLIQHINPDELQITERMVDTYDYTLTEKVTHHTGEEVYFLHLNPDTNVDKATRVLHIKPELSQQ